MFLYLCISFGKGTSTAICWLVMEHVYKQINKKETSLPEEGASAQLDLKQDVCSEMNINTLTLKGTNRKVRKIERKKCI